MYFRFRGCRHVSTNGPYGASRRVGIPQCREDNVQQTKLYCIDCSIDRVEIY